jgi:hypothetical protein
MGAIGNIAQVPKVSAPMDGAQKRADDSAISCKGFGADKIKGRRGYLDQDGANNEWN